jgi:hypothetical protein
MNGERPPAEGVFGVRAMSKSDGTAHLIGDHAERDVGGGCRFADTPFVVGKDE